MLAINGGEKICEDIWIKWPIPNLRTKNLLSKTLDSRRWTIRGWYNGEKSKQIEFSERFADYMNSKHCILTSSGSTGLIIALEACDIGFGDEVIVPIYTWIATAIAVLNVNAIPIFVDVNEATGCISPEAIEKNVTQKTKAIIPVHLHNSIADMNSILHIANKHNLYVIEDCSQAHCAQYYNKYVGTLGNIGVFSMNQEKVLCCGEGGAVITNDTNLADRLWRLCADGARLTNQQPIIGRYEMIDTGGLLGSNYCMSDFQASILMSELDLLEERNRVRKFNANYLDEKLSEIGSFPMQTSPGTTDRTYFKYSIRIEPTLLGDISIDEIGDALSKELNFDISKTECQPLHQNILYCPHTKQRHKINKDYQESIDISYLRFPVAELLYKTTLVFHHRILLSENKYMKYIVDAFKKVMDNLDDIKSRSR